MKYRHLSRLINDQVLGRDLIYYAPFLTNLQCIQVELELQPACAAPALLHKDSDMAAPVMAKQKRGKMASLRRLLNTLCEDDDLMCPNSIEREASVCDTECCEEAQPNIHRSAAEATADLGQQAAPFSEVMAELRQCVEELKRRGYPLDAIHELIDMQETLSRLLITDDLRIFLPDYNNLEITMPALPKTLFLFFLRYPDGIVLKDLIDHEREILNIYAQLNPRYSEERRRTTVAQLLDPFCNSIHENITRIRKAFIDKFDDHLAKNYYISGEKGGLYRIALNPDLVMWEE